MKNRIIAFFLLTAGLTQGATAQRLLSLDSCRAMALRNNKQLSISRVKQDVAANLRKSARTQYLPHISALGGYEWTSKEISLLSDEQKENLSNLGTSLASGISGKASEMLGQVPQGVWEMLGAMGITPEGIAGTLGKIAMPLASSINGVGQGIVDAFHTDTRNMFAGAVMVTQPVFMGGAIIAMNKMADIGEDMAANASEQQRQTTLFNIDKTYWQVVSLRHKQKLAQGYLELVKKLDGDVQKMIEEGVATRSEGLSVSVKVNEAEMMLTKIDDGLVLSKMLLCQLCGMPVSEQIVLADEEREDLSAVELVPQLEVEAALSNRPELKQLQNLLDLSKQQTNVLKAGNLPQVALTGGYMVSNPNLYNGFQRKFSGVWNVGVLVRIPIWNWGDVAYKVRASKGATTIARLQMDEAREKITLQVNQSNFQVQEANKNLEMTKANIRKAEENLRTADLGFREGVISSTTVMEAQTAWLQAQSQKIDAEIEVKLSQVNLKKALGTLQ
jgi:outer membrane protein TolC